MILFSHGVFNLNWFDVIILLSTITFPFGAFYEKRALFKVNPESLLFFRSFLGGLLLLFMSFLLENPADPVGIFQTHWKLFLFNGFLVAFFSKALWYRALKRLDISKAIAINMTYPLFSLVFFTTFLGRPVYLFQWLGLLIMLIGIHYSIQRRSTDPKNTLYCLR